MTTQPLSEPQREARDVARPETSPLPMAPKEPCRGDCPDCPNRPFVPEASA